MTDKELDILQAIREQICAAVTVMEGKSREIPPGFGQMIATSNWDISRAKLFLVIDRLNRLGGDR